MIVSRLRSPAKWTASASPRESRSSVSGCQQRSIAVHLALDVASGGPEPAERLQEIGKALLRHEASDGDDLYVRVSGDPRPRSAAAVA